MQARRQIKWVVEQLHRRIVLSHWNGIAMLLCRIDMG